VRINITYKCAGADPVTVTTTLAVIVAWERKYKQKASSMASAAGVEDVAFLAYESAKAARLTVPAVFDDFLAKLETVEVVGDEPAFPTRAVPGDTD